MVSCIKFNRKTGTIFKHGYISLCNLSHGYCFDSLLTIDLAFLLKIHKCYILVNHWIGNSLLIDTVE